MVNILASHFVHDRVIIPGTFQTPHRGLLRNNLRYAVVGYFPLVVYRLKIRCVVGLGLVIRN